MPQFNEGNVNSYLVPSGSLNGSLSNSGTLTGQIAIGSGGGTSDYNDLSNKPQINSVTLSGNKTTSDLNISYNDLTDKPTIPAAQVNSDWNAESGVAEILNKPTIPSTLGSLSDVDTTGAFNGASLGYYNGTWVPEIIQPAAPDVERLHNFKTTPALTTGQVLKLSHGAPVTEWTNGFVSYNELTDKPTIPAAQVNSDWNAASGVAEILNKPTLATVATSGSYNDLTDQPTIPNLTPVDVTSQITITKNSGNWSVNDYTAYRSGNVVTLYIKFEGNGNTVNAGSNAFQGNVSGIRPILLSYGTAYISSSATVTGLWSTGGITVRVTGANVTLGSSSTSEFSITYITNN